MYACRWSASSFVINAPRILSARARFINSLASFPVRSDITLRLVAYSLAPAATSRSVIDLNLPEAC